MSAVQDRAHRSPFVAPDVIGELATGEAVGVAFRDLRQHCSVPLVPFGDQPVIDFLVSFPIKLSCLVSVASSKARSMSVGH